MGRQGPSPRLVAEVRTLIDHAQAGDREAQHKLRDFLHRKRAQMPDVLYVLFVESVEESYFPTKPKGL